MHAIFGISDVLDTHRDNENTIRLIEFTCSLSVFVTLVTGNICLNIYLVRTIANTSHALLVGSVSMDDFLPTAEDSMWEREKTHK